ncbi:hypothetical protein SPD48_09810 [Pseudogracilibacillus sp. SE30717A]|uniref:hypothetical protein n=1 Tax=Pseudogracilibacillus sp. SE30717A TaxID=3098293 RepID=UPI00300E1FCC
MKNADKKSTKKIPKQHDYHEDERTPLDDFENQKFTDTIPMEDLKINAEQEKKQHKTQDDSQSEEKYKGDFDERMR